MSPVIATIGPERITVKDFETAYAKNNGGWENGVAASLEERERFLNLLVKFRLKVLEARERGIASDSSIQQELQTYGLSIATSYMLDKELVEPAVRSLFDRKKEEVRASHILIRLQENPTPGDTAAAYQKAMDIIAQLPTVPFDTLAVRYSEDPSAATNHGDLGYFTAGRMVPDFEEAVFSMKKGQYSKFPARSQFGYHIIYLADRRPASGAIRLSHILKRFAQNLEDTVAVRDSAWAIYRRIKGGMDFAVAAEEYSDDPGTVMRGGELGFFERSRLPESIASQFYENPIGTVFEPMQFPYGYHIFQTKEIKPVPQFAEMEQEIRSQYQNTRYQTDYQNFLQQLKKKFHLSLDVPTMYELTHAFDTTATPARTGWSDTLTSRMLGQTLVTLSDKVYRVQDLIEFINTSGEFKNTLLTTVNVETIVERFTEIKVLELEALNMPKRHPEFDQLMKDYEDGVLLFKVEQDEVWNKIDNSESAILSYFEDHVEDYKTVDLVNVQEILVNDKSTADSVYKKFQAGADFSELASKYTMRPTTDKKQGVWGLLPVDTRDITKKAWTMAVDSVSEPFEANEGWALIKVLEKQPSREKKYDEVIAEVASAYREFASKQREEVWVNELRKKYGVVTSTELLKEAFRETSGETN